MYAEPRRNNLIKNDKFYLKRMPSIFTSALYQWAHLREMKAIGSYSGFICRRKPNASTAKREMYINSSFGISKNKVKTKFTFNIIPSSFCLLNFLNY